MREAVQKIKDALAAKDMGANLNYFHLHEGYIGCGNGAVTMATPIKQTDLSCLLPGAELDLLLDRLPPENLKITVKDRDILFSTGRTWGKVPMLPLEQMSFLQPEHEWAKPPAALLPALAAVRPFIAEVAARPWGTCASLSNRYIYGTNNITLLRATCDGLEVPESLLLPVKTIDLVLKRKAPLTGVILTSTYVAFWWSDGTWLRSALVQDKFPEETVNKLLAHDAVYVPIEAEWRRECKMLAETLEHNITIEQQRMHGANGKATMETTIESAVALATHFNPKFLAPVVAMATEWALSMYPKPIPFRAPGVEGLLMGKTV